MGATTLTAFDADPKYLGLVKTFKAASAILRGAVVGFADAGASNTVAPSTSSLGMPIGVALNSQATAGQSVAVAMQGSVVKVMLSADNAGLDAGHFVTSSTVAGCVVEFDPGLINHAAHLSVGLYPLGITLEDIAAGDSAGTGGVGYILIKPSPIYTKSS